MPELLLGSYNTASWVYRLLNFSTQQNRRALFFMRAQRAQSSWKEHYTKLQTIERPGFAMSGHDPTIQVATAVEHIKLAGEFDFTVIVSFFFFFFCPYFSFPEFPFLSCAQKSFPMWCFDFLDGPSPCPSFLLHAFMSWKRATECVWLRPSSVPLFCRIRRRWLIVVCWILRPRWTNVKITGLVAGSKCVYQERLQSPLWAFPHDFWQQTTHLLLYWKQAPWKFGIEQSIDDKPEVDMQGWTKFMIGRGMERRFLRSLPLDLSN